MAVLGLTILLLIAQFTPFQDWRDPKTILAGHWESCREADGTRRERIYDHCVLGHCDWELHLGPNDEFVLFKGVQETHRAHDTTANLLYPGYHVGSLDTATHSRQWSALGVWISVVEAGGSSDACDGGSDYPEFSYFVLVTRK